MSRRIFLSSFGIILSIVWGMVSFTPALAAGCDTNTVIFSEIDYDQPSTDTAEFIELRILADVSLTNCELQLVNGSNSAKYQTIDLTGSYTAGKYLVIGSTGVPSRDITIGGSCASDCIQNSTDGFALVDTSGGGNILIWFYSYEGVITGYNPGDGSSNTSTRLTHNGTGVNDSNTNNISVHNGPDTGVDDCYHDTPNPGNPGPTAITLASFTAQSRPNLSGLLVILIIATSLNIVMILQRDQKKPH